MNTKFAKQVMMILSNLVKKDEKKILGRWNLESCDKKMNHTPFHISNADP